MCCLYIDKIGQCVVLLHCNNPQSTYRKHYITNMIQVLQFFSTLIPPPTVSTVTDNKHLSIDLVHRQQRQHVGTLNGWYSPAVTVHHGQCPVYDPPRLVSCSPSVCLKTVDTTQQQFYILFKT